MTAYNLEVRISKQEDGLWRAEVPSLPGCFVDSETLHEALNDIQEVAAMMLDLNAEEGRALPRSLSLGEGGSFTSQIPVIVEEHSIRRPKRKKLAS